MILDEALSDKISKYFHDFQNYLETEEARDWDEDLDAHRSLFGTTLGKDAMEGITKDDFRGILQELFANEWWTNKDYPTNRVLNLNNFDTLKSELKNLLWGTDPLPNDTIDFVGRQRD